MSESFAISWTVAHQPGSSVHRTFQARILEWVAIPFSRGSSPPRDWTQVFCTAGRFCTTEPGDRKRNCSLGLIQETWKRSPGESESTWGNLALKGIRCQFFIFLLRENLFKELPRALARGWVSSTVGGILMSVSVQFSCSVVSDSLLPHVSQHARPPCPSPTLGV